MARRLIELVERWCDLRGVEAGPRPDPAALAAGFHSDPEACRPGAEPADVAAWERRHGYDLPGGLCDWLALSNGLFAEGPLIHPLFAIGPMVPFARVRGLLVSPESWFELGNPNVETVCLDLAYRLPGGDNPVFTSGDDERGTRPRLIADGFDAWFLRLLREGGREYWFRPGFVDLGDPWLEHREHVPPPALADRLRPIASRVSLLIEEGLDDRAIASRFGIGAFDVEEIARHVQHARPPIREAARGRRD